MKLAEFKDARPHFVLEDYFMGETRAWGIFEDRFGNLRKQFYVSIQGFWEQDEFVLDEKFSYHDGETDQRVWRIRQPQNARYEGTADDVIGVARGEASGNALRWRYKMSLKIASRSWTVAFDDWMFLQQDGVLINRAKVSKWGIKLGEATIFFMKEASGTITT